LSSVDGEYITTAAPNVCKCSFLHGQTPREAVKFVNDKRVRVARLNGFKRGSQARTIAGIKASRKTFVAVNE
jgi:hypothetical protein